jgi:hypothetical protein
MRIMSLPFNAAGLSHCVRAVPDASPRDSIPATSSVLRSSEAVKVVQPRLGALEATLGARSGRAGCTAICLSVGADRWRHRGWVGWPRAPLFGKRPRAPTFARRHPDPPRIHHGRGEPGRTNVLPANPTKLVGVSQAGKYSVRHGRTTASVSNRGAKCPNSGLPPCSCLVIRSTL